MTYGTGAHASYLTGSGYAQFTSSPSNTATNQGDSITSSPAFTQTSPSVVSSPSTVLDLASSLTSVQTSVPLTSILTVTPPVDLTSTVVPTTVTPPVDLTSTIIPPVVTAPVEIPPVITAPEAGQPFALYVSPLSSLKKRQAAEGAAGSYLQLQSSGLGYDVLVLVDITDPHSTFTLDNYGDLMTTEGTLAALEIAGGDPPVMTYGDDSFKFYPSTDDGENTAYCSILSDGELNCFDDQREGFYTCATGPQYLFIGDNFGPGCQAVHILADAVTPTATTPTTPADPPVDPPVVVSTPDKDLVLTANLGANSYSLVTLTEDDVEYMVLADPSTPPDIFRLTGDGYLQPSDAGSIAGLGTDDNSIHLIPTADNGDKAICAVDASGVFTCTDGSKTRFYACTGDGDSVKLRLGQKPFFDGFGCQYVEVDAVDVTGNT